MKHSYEIKADLDKKTFQYTEFLDNKKIVSGTMRLDMLPVYREFLERIGAMGTIEF